jgi:hypothetical protein
LEDETSHGILILWQVASAIGLLFTKHDAKFRATEATLRIISQGCRTRGARRWTYELGESPDAASSDRDRKSVFLNLTAEQFARMLTRQGAP